MSRLSLNYKITSPNSLEFIFILGFVSSVLCLILSHFFLEISLLVIAFSASIAFFFILILFRFTQLGLFLLVFFLLINAVFVNFVPTLIGYLTKEVLLLFVFIAWFINLLLSGKTKLSYYKFGGIEYILVFLIFYMFIESLRQTPLIIGFFGFRSIILYAPIYFLIPLIIRTKNNVEKVFKVLFLSVFLISIIGIIQYFSSKFVMELLGFNYGEVAFRSVRGHLKTSATLGNASAFGTIISIFLLIYISIKSFSQVDEKKNIQRWGEFFIIVILSVSLILSFSRVSMLGFLTGFIFLVALIKTNRVKFFIIGFIIFLLANLVFDNFLAEFLMSAFGLGSAEKGIQSAMDRWNIIQASFSELIPKRPLFGWGLGITGAPSFRNASIAPFGYLLMDNYYLKLVVESGFFGCLTYLCLLFGCIWRGFKYFKEIGDTYLKGIAFGISLSLISIGIINIASTVLEMPSVNIIFWILLGLLPVLKSIDTKNCERDFELLKL